VLKSPLEVCQVVSVKAHCPCSRVPTFDSIEVTNSTLRSPIQILNDDVLLNIFYLYKLDFEGEDSAKKVRFKWDRQRWWYKLAQVSRKWRYLILASPIRLDIHLLCTYGVLVADMLAHSPPLPLTIWYTNCDREMTAKDEDDVLLALSHRDRVHRIALCMQASKLGKFIKAMHYEFPILERVYIDSQRTSTGYMFPWTFKAPNLRHVWTACCPIGSPLVTTVRLINLALMDIPPSPWSPPSYILTRLSLMPQLTTLRIHFNSFYPNRGDVEPPAATDLTLPNLQIFSYRGVSAYFEGLARIRAPTLSVLDVQFFHRLTFPIPRLLQFMRASESLRFGAVKLTFDNDFLELTAGPDPSWQRRSLRLQIMCKHLYWQVESAVQVFDSISPLLSRVDELTLLHVASNLPAVSGHEVNRTQWRKLLRSFNNVKTLSVPEGAGASAAESRAPSATAGAAGADAASSGVAVVKASEQQCLCSELLHGGLHQWHVSLQLAVPESSVRSMYSLSLTFNRFILSGTTFPLTCAGRHNRHWQSKSPA
jgi:hypothetical protein